MSGQTAEMTVIPGSPRNRRISRWGICASSDQGEENDVVTTDESHENRSAEIEENHDDFLEPRSDQGSSGTKDLHNNDHTWHIGRDFIDPLAKELGEWLKKPVDTAEQIIENIEALTYFDVGVDGIGSDTSVAAWARAKVWLDLNVSVEFRNSFESEIRTVSSKSQDLLRRLRRLKANQDTEDWNVEIFSFSFQVVEPVLEYLQNMSRFLEQRTAERGGGGAPTGSGDGDVSGQIAELQKYVRKPKSKREQINEQRVKFCRPRVEKEEPWSDIYMAYYAKYPEDKKASRGALRLTWKRYSDKF